MASLAVACRMSARVTARQLQHNGAARGFRSCAASLAAQNFSMPALSPTMTEGNIASWKVKEGDTFVAGDVLLEIETDKASMDVEAQDDGIVAKIIQGDGSKGIQVGSRIAVLAESGDDISTLDIPPEEGPKKAAPKEEAKAAAPKAEPKSDSSNSDGPQKKTTKAAKSQTYPLLPSVGHLIKEHNLDASSVDKMVPSGPNNRLLKGDVLAYIGSISASSPIDIQNRIAKLSHLDLSNIKAVVSTPSKKATAPPVKPTAEPIEDLRITIPVSLEAVLEVQERIRSTLGVFMPLETFISRATDIANDDLIYSKLRKPSPNDLFNQVLGLRLSGGTRGNFLPQISSLSNPGLGRQSLPKKNVDLFDILTRSSRAPSSPTRVAEPVDMESFTRVLSVKVPPEEKKRAEFFIGRVKTVLEADPGRLVL